MSKQRAGLGPTYCNKTFALFAFNFIPWVLLLFEKTFFFHRNYLTNMKHADLEFDDLKIPKEIAQKIKPAGCSTCLILMFH